MEWEYATVARCGSLLMQNSNMTLTEEDEMGIVDRKIFGGNREIVKYILKFILQSSKKIKTMHIFCVSIDLLCCKN
jgi:hypothetical protein